MSTSNVTALPNAPGAVPILEARALVKAYGGVRAADGINLSVTEGQLRCVIGPNGAGKSTFFKLLMGTERPTEGQILFRGHDITRLKSFERARLGITAKFQNVPIYQELTVAQNMFIPLRRHFTSTQIPNETERLLEQLNLSGTQNLPARSLSHGQQQWLAIGMSLAAKPVVLLLDEPTAGMSPEETHHTGEIVQRLNRQGVTVIVIEHDMAFVRQLGGRVTVLHYGRLFAEGSMDEIERHEDVRRIYLGGEAA